MMSVASSETRETDIKLWLVRVCVACSIAMLGFPVPEGYDITQHLRFAATYRDAILAGSFMPNWAAVDNFGFGGVGVRIYPPLADYVLAVTQLITNDWYETLLLTSFFWMIPGCIGVFLLVREIRDSQCGWIAALLYSLMPYHLLQIYRMQLYSEFVAAALLPWCFLFAARLVKHSRISNVIGLGISCSLLLLTHIPATIVGMLGLLVYVAVIVDWRSYLSIVPRLALGGILALGGSAFYLVRLINEVPWVKHSSEEFSSGFYLYYRFFFPIFANFGTLYSEHSLLRLDVATGVTLLFFVPILLCVALLGFRAMEWKSGKPWILGLAATSLVSAFMLSTLSRFVWYSLDILQQLQFPFRFLTLVSMTGAIFLALAISIALESRRKTMKIVLVLSIALIGGTVVFDLTSIIFASTPMSREDFYTTMVDVRESEGCTCWWPTWSEPKALENRRPATIASRNAEILRWDSEVRQVRVESGDPGQLRLATFYYPYWSADINGSDVPLTIDDGGAIVLSTPAEESLVTIRFEEPAVYGIALWISAVTWIVLMLGAVYCITSKYWKRRLDQGAT